MFSFSTYIILGDQWVQRPTLTTSDFPTERLHKPRMTKAKKASRINEGNRLLMKLASKDVPIKIG